MPRVLATALSLLIAFPLHAWSVNARPIVVGRGQPVATVPALKFQPGAGLARSASFAGVPSGGPLLLQPGATLPLPKTLALQAPEVRAGPRVAALERLAADVPFRAPRAGNLAAEKDFAGKAFDFKLGSDEASVSAGIGAGGSGGDGGGTGRSDDGGGAGYPRRDVHFNGHVFPSVAFRPNIPIEEKIVEAIDASKKTIQIAVYEFKLRGILDALRRARARGVKVEIVIDYSNVFPTYDPSAEYKPKRSKEVWALLREGFDVSVLRGTGEFGIMHNKFAVFDGKLAKYGSFNWSYTAENNHYENAQFTDDKGRIKDLQAYWEYLRGLSKPATHASKASDYEWPSSYPPPPAPKHSKVLFNGVELPALIFSPSGILEDAIVAAIGASKESVDISMFALRSTRIAEAVAAAKKRGLRVRVIIDEKQAADDSFKDYTQWLAFQGVEVRLRAGPNPDSPYPLAEKNHHKVAIFDGKLVETGSPNYTKYGSKANFENGHFLDDKTDVSAYVFIFEHLFSISKAVPKPEAAPNLPTDEQLQEEIERQPKPSEPVPPPDTSGRPKPGMVKFNGKLFPDSMFRPGDPIEAKLVEAIDAAQKTLRIAIYEFTLESVMEALRRAKKRGVKIELVIDRGHVYTSGKDSSGQARKPSAQILALIEEGFDVLVLKGKRSGIMHNKLAVFDDKMVEFGSYNWTKYAELNHFENAVFHTNKARVSYYLKNFQFMREQAEPVDREKLDEVLNRTLAAEETPAEPGAGEEEEQSPPEDPKTPIDLNGTKFPNQLFSPAGGIEAALISAIKAAKSSIDIAMFSFYSEKIAQALMDARKERPELMIRILLDYSQAGLAKLDDWFAYHGFDVKLLAGPNEGQGDPMFEKMHHKFMLVDGKWLETGSFNYSPNAENNSYENANFLVDASIVARFAWEFARMWELGWKPKPPKTAPALHPAADPQFADVVMKY